MPYPKRASAPTNTIRLTLDFDSLDRLCELAGERRTSMDRCAYELLQEALGRRPAPAVSSRAALAAALHEPEDRVGAMLARINQPSKGTA